MKKSKPQTNKSASQKAASQKAASQKAASQKAASQKAASQKPASQKSPSQLIDAKIKELDDWRGETLSRLRALVKEADPEVVEEWKWRGVPVWSHDGLICTGETYKSVVKMTFAKGAALKDPSRLFNSSLEGNVRRAIDVHEGDTINEDALKALIRAAVALNRSKTKR
jgi:hypothetical protein